MFFELPQNFLSMTMIFIRSIVAPSHWDTMSDKDSASLQAQSVAASQVAQTVTPLLKDCLIVFLSNFRLSGHWARWRAPCQRAWPSTTPTTPLMPRSEPGFSLENSTWDLAKWTLQRCAAPRHAKYFLSPTWSSTCEAPSTSLGRSGRRQRPACRTRFRSIQGTWPAFKRLACFTWGLAVHVWVNWL